MVGTLAMAFLKAASFMPAKALRPARINSLFLTPTPKVKARFFISTIWISSVLGMVKLSRTTLTFLSFRGLAGAAACFFTTGALAALAAGLASAFTAGLGGNDLEVDGLEVDGLAADVLALETFLAALAGDEAFWGAGAAALVAVSAFWGAGVGAGAGAAVLLGAAFGAAGAVFNSVEAAF